MQNNSYKVKPKDASKCVKHWRNNSAFKKKLMVTFSVLTSFYFIASAMVWSRFFELCLFPVLTTQHVHSTSLNKRKVALIIS